MSLLARPLRPRAHCLHTPPRYPSPTAKKDEAAEPSLFNLADDPGEKNDVAAKHPAIVTKLRAEATQRETEIIKNKRPAGSIWGRSERPRKYAVSMK
jgi:hypothetical protein